MAADGMKAIYSTTLTATTTSITIGGIAANYRDLRLVISASGLSDDVLIQFNGDGGANYSRVYMFGQSGGVVSGTGGTTFISAGYIGSGITPLIVDIMDYSISKHKTTVSRSSDNAVVGAVAGRWASNAVINSITIYRAGSNAFAIGNTFSLYGIVG